MTVARRLDALEDQVVRIERLQKDLRAEITNVAETVRLAAAQLRRDARKRGKTTAR